MHQAHTKNFQIKDLHHELQVLCNAVSYSNLSAAADQIGMSQPQISRIVSRIENSMNVVLLDRSSARKSGWMPIAYQLAETYRAESKKLETELQGLLSALPIRDLRVGTLEGSLAVALPHLHRLSKRIELDRLEIDVYDQSELEDAFLKGKLDLILTLRSPGRRKYKYIHKLGHQTLLRIEPSTKSKSPPFWVASSFEELTIGKNPMPGPKLISNSLAVRKTWLETYGGYGSLPGELSHKGEFTLYWYAADHLDSTIWTKLTKGS